MSELHPAIAPLVVRFPLAVITLFSCLLLFALVCSHLSHCSHFSLISLSFWTGVRLPRYRGDGRRPDVRPDWWATLEAYLNAVQLHHQATGGGAPSASAPGDR